MSDVKPTESRDQLAAIVEASKERSEKEKANFLKAYAERKARRLQAFNSTDPTRLEARMKRLAISQPASPQPQQDNFIRVSDEEYRQARTQFEWGRAGRHDFATPMSTSEEEQAPRRESASDTKTP
ncbi:MAG: hypothetical protein EOO40_03870 [Deltaproteobacteria bacterium]|nr:MAG: hypothetical protein EOO40_03870 [Deltaproteobacteria bacterium]